MELDLPDLQASICFGRKLGKLSLPGDIITLVGDLGAGKTALTQAIGLGLEVPESHYITSPTFALIHEYPGRIPLYHMDLYRLASEEEVEYLGFDEYLYGNGLTVIEWPDRLQSLMPRERLNITLSFTSATARKAVLTSYGHQWRHRINRLIQ